MSEKQERVGREALTTGQLLFRVCSLARERMRVHLDRLGIHRGQGFVLWRLGEQDGLAQGELARGLNVTPATVSGTLRRMEEAGWVVRRADPLDQRISRVYLTSRGRQLRRQLVEAFRAMEKELVAGFCPGEEAELKTALEKLRANLRSGDSREDS